jgi:peptidyl-prolyl cis-trans isomerase C
MSLAARPEIRIRLNAERLKAKVEERAVRQYVSFLAGQAEVRGVDVNAAPTPLVQ